MSAQQGIYACRIAVDREVADVLRIEAKKVLMFNHEWFEDFLDFTPVGQEALATIYRDALDVIEAVGWDPDRDADADDEPIDVPLTDGHIEQLHRRRHDLGATNLDLLDDLDETEDNEQAVTIRAEITANRLAAQALNRLFTDYGRATAG
jgi:hypothetical protein